MKYPPLLLRLRRYRRALWMRPNWPAAVIGLLLLLALCAEWWK